ncbi:tyrosine--tRNA ligase [Aestuariirhabdus litorea]|uniref:Tyrosine--tRNA ligase n=1 Tax=Aestuariirhabdus litorea TaxID=2528527 RepID=A0A3P3VLF8_9GAMM|nr:tyrosine--tRNA ligase [Aestuariirhabdus litorea]RRJ83460.1 tyrosine--tRNA ligase [Aestuariirhabdus litorea]RWW93621.1 tyrosine--tRNA ligase [Endozoicomonadaceae bacterium GTF-13]
MSQGQNALLRDLQARGLVAQMTAEQELSDQLDSGICTLYCGFDPTADSLHIGSLVPLLALKRFQLAGHKPLALVGGATGLIGDPSFKAQERSLNTRDVVEGWVDKIRTQVSQFVDFECGDNAAEVVNNLDWIGGMDVLTFLRDVGKYFSVNSMIKKESVRQRIDRDESGISYTEFTYMLLQSYDFAELNRRHNCVLQIGGSDQWGNITGGTELTRRMNGNQVFGMTLPLVTKADGTKFGKTESGTIWLDSRKTSQYAFYQFWINTADADVYKFLRYFTFLDVAEIEAIEQRDAETQGAKSAQKILATEVTRLVHGDEGLQAALRITEALFNDGIETLSEQDLQQLALDGLPSDTLDPSTFEGKPLTQLLAEVGMAPSGKQVKDALGRNAVLVNGKACSMEHNMQLAQLFAADQALFGRYFIVKLGKKKYHLLQLP